MSPDCFLFDFVSGYFKTVVYCYFLKALIVDDGPILRSPGLVMYHDSINT